MTIDPKSLEAAARAAFDANAADVRASNDGRILVSQDDEEAWSWTRSYHLLLAHAAITAFLEAEAAQGRRMMPRVPNADMASAGQGAIQNPIQFNERRIITAQQVWIAMFDAAEEAKPHG